MATKKKKETVQRPTTQSVYEEILKNHGVQADAVASSKQTTSQSKTQSLYNSILESAQKREKEKAQKQTTRQRLYLDQYNKLVKTVNSGTYNASQVESEANRLSGLYKDFFSDDSGSDMLTGLEEIKKTARRSTSSSGILPEEAEAMRKQRTQWQTELDAIDYDALSDRLDEITRNRTPDEYERDPEYQQILSAFDSEQVLKDKIADADVQLNLYDRTDKFHSERIDPLKKKEGFSTSRETWNKTATDKIVTHDSRVSQCMAENQERKDSEMSALTEDRDATQAELDAILASDEYKKAQNLYQGTPEQQGTIVKEAELRKKVADLDAQIAEKEAEELPGEKDTYLNLLTEQIDELTRNRTADEYGRDPEYQAALSAYEQVEEAYALGEYLDWYNGLDEDTRERLLEGRLNAQDPRNREIVKSTPSTVGKHWERMTEDEINAYYYIANTEGAQAAHDFLEDLQVTLDKRHTEGREQATIEQMEESPTWANALRGVATVGANVVGGPMAFASDAIRTAEGKDFNPYSNAHYLQNITGVTRSAAANDIQQTFAGDGKSAFWNGVGELAANAYQSALSSLDSVAGMYTMGKWYTVSMGMGAASSRMRELYESGATDEEIYAGAIGSGFIEAFFEKFSLDALAEDFIKANPEKWVKKLAAQAGVEGSEEFFTEIANLVWDSINRGINSDHNQRVRELMGNAENPMGREEAEHQATKEDAMDVFWAFLGGVMSGGMSSVSGAVMDASRQNQSGQDILSRNVQEQIIAEGKELRQGDKLAQSLETKQKEGTLGKNEGIFSGIKDSRDATRLGRLLEQNVADMTSRDRSAVKSAVEARLKAEGTHILDKEGTAEAIVKSLGGEGLGVYDRFLLASNEKVADKVRNEVYSAADGTTADNAWVKRIETYGHTTGTTLKETAVEKAGREAMETTVKEEFGQHAETVMKLYNINRGLQNRMDFVAEAKEVYQAGMDGVPLDQAPKTTTLTDFQREAVWDMGQGKSDYDYDNNQGFATIKGETTPVNIVAVESTDGGTLTLRTDDGQVVSAKDVTFGSYSQSKLYSVIAAMGVDTETANQIVTMSNETGLDLNVFSRAMQDAFFAGRNGIPFADIPKERYAMKLTEEQRKVAWKAGRAAARERAVQKGKRVQQGKHGRAKGGVKMEASARNIQNLNAQQQAGMNAANVLGALGLDITVYASTEEQRAKGMENGYIQLSDGSIHIDLNSGDSGEGVMAWALSHEFTHFVEELSPEKFQTFQEILFDQLGQKQQDVMELIEAKVAELSGQEHYSGLSEERLWEIATSEVVAEMMEPMLTDTDAIARISDQLRQQDKSLWTKIKDWLTGLVEKLKNAYKDLTPGSAIARQTREVVTHSEAILNAWVDVATDAIVNYNLQDGQKNNTPGGVRYSMRGVNQDGIEVYETSDEVKALPYQLRQKRFLDIMVNEYRGRTAKFVRDGSTYYATFETGDVNKNIYGDKRSDTKGWKAKINVGADGNIFELVENATYAGSKQESGKEIPMHRNVDSWDYFVKNVQIDGTVYDLLANVRKRSNGEFVYSIQLRQNKKIKASPPLGSLLRASNGVTNASTGSIRSESQNVNPEDTLFSSRNSIPQEQNQEMEDHFGTTSNYDVAGYILTDGKMLDFSGRHWGDTSSNYRQVDHRDIWEVWEHDDLNGLQEMVSLIAGGGIRLSPESGGINLFAMPNQQQISTLRGYINHFGGDVSVDIDSADGKTVQSFTYGRGVSSSKVISDLRAYFESGAVPESRESVRDFLYSQRSVTQLERENEKLRQDKEYLKELVKIQRQGNKDFVPTRASVNSMAEALKKQNGVRGNTAELAALLDEFYRYIGKGNLDAAEMDRLVGKAADWLQEHQQAKRDPYAQEVLDWMKKRHVSLSQTQVDEIKYQYGSLREYQSAIKGSIIIDQNATLSLDQLWQEGNNQYADQFGSDVPEGDMPGAFADMVERLRNSEDTDTAERRYRQEEFHRDLMDQVYNTYFSVKPVESISDTMQEKINSLLAEKANADRTNKQLERQNEKLRQKKDELKKKQAESIKQYRQKRDAADKAMKQQYEKQHSEVQKQYREQMAEMEASYSQDSRTMEREFKRLVKEYDKQEASLETVRERLEQSAKELAGSKENEEIWKQEFNRLLRAYDQSGRNIGKLEQTIERQRATAKAKVESRAKTELRGKLQRSVDALNRMLLNPTKTQYVPDSLQPAVLQALEVMNNLRTPDAADVAWNPKYQAYQAELLGLLKEGGSRKNMKRINQIVRLMDEMEARSTARVAKDVRLQEALSSMKERYAKLADSNEGIVAQVYDEQVAEFIQDALDAVKDTPYSELNKDQLTAVKDAYAAILHRVRTANKAFLKGKSEEITQLAKNARNEISAKADKKKLTNAPLQKLSEFEWNNLKPVYAFERMGSATMTTLYNNLRNGEDTFYRDVSDGRTYALATMEKYGYEKWQDELITFTSTGGKQFALNLEERMSLYAYSRREQAIEHLMKGGIILSDNTKRTVKNRLGVNTEMILNDKNIYTLSLDTIQQIADSLTAEQKAFAQEMQAYLSTVCAAKNNEISQKLYGVSIAKEKFYWPLLSSKLFSEKAKDSQENPGNRQKNASHMKSTMKHANNPIVLSGFMDTWANHVNNTAMYHAFTLPMEDFYRVYNFKQLGSETGDSQSIQQLIALKYGEAATKYIDQFLKDLNKGARSDPRESIGRSLTSKFKKGAVSASLSVAAQQPSAVGRAFAVIDFKYFRFTDMKYYGTSLAGEKAEKTQARWEEMKRYAPVVGIKEMGRFDVNMGRSTVDFITGAGQTGFMAKVDELSGYLPEKMDQATWMMIYNAAERQCKAQGYTGENLKVATAKLFTEAITRTQVYDSVFSRSGNMRSKSLWANMATSFMAEPTTTANMFLSAVADIRNGDKQTGKRKIASIATATVLNAFLASLVYAARDDDEDSPYREKLLKSFTSELVDSFNPLGYVPVVKDIWSLFQGYDVDRSDMTLWSEAAKALKRVVSAHEAMAELDEDDADYEKDLADAQKNVAEAWLNAAGALCNMFGLPVKNLTRDIKALVNTVMTVAEDRDADWTTSKRSMWEGVLENLPEVIPKDSKSDELYKAMTSKSQVWVNRMRDSYSSDKAYESAVRKTLREHDKRIRQAAKALNNNADSTEYKRLVNAILSEKHFTQEQVEKAIQAEARAISGSLSGQSTQSIEKFIDLYEDNLLDAEQYMAFMEYKDAVGEDGKKIHHKDEMVTYIGSMKVNAKAKDALYNLMDYDEKDLEKMPWHTSGYSLWEARVEIPELANYSDSAVETFLEIRNSQITVKVFTSAYEYRNAKDSEGKQLHTPEEIMAYIDSLGLSRENKDELYLAMGYKETTLNKTPWN